MVRDKRRVSIVVIARNEGAELRRTVENLEATLPGGGEIVVVDDGSEDGSADFLGRRRPGVRLYRTRDLGVARARNYGAARARGDALVFADAHVRAGEGWWTPLEQALARPHAGAAAPAVRSMNNPRAVGYGLRFTGPDMEVEWLPRKSARPFEAPIVPGCFLAMTRETFLDTGGWDAGLQQRGGVDNELSVRFWLLGYRLFIVPAVEVRHVFRDRSPFPVGWREFLQNRLRLAFVHFSAPRVCAAVAALARHDELGEAMLALLSSDVSARREEFLMRRTRNDDWYFKHFGLEW